MANVNHLQELNTLKFNKNYGQWFLNDVIHAITRYGMIDHDEHLCVALSGGKDSVALTYILAYLTRYSYLRFTLSALHVKTGDYDTSVLQTFCIGLDIRYLEECMIPGSTRSDTNICYTCARLKRGAMSQRLTQEGIRTIAYGHHADDAAETFFMNMVQNRKLGSFSPKVEIADSQMIIIRPMIYLTEAAIQRIHAHLGLPTLDWQCPHAAANIRNSYKQGVSQLNSVFQTTDFPQKLVASLENIDTTNLWSSRECPSSTVNP